MSKRFVLNGERMRWLRIVWPGNEKLWKVFLLGGVIVPLGGWYVLMSLPMKLSGHGLMRLSYFMVLLTILNSWLVVPLWRCAANTNWWVWTRLARMFTLLLVGQILYFIWDGGFEDLSFHKRAAVLCRQILIVQVGSKHADVAQYVASHSSEEQLCRDNLADALR